MSKISIGGYGIMNYLFQRSRRNNFESQKLINIDTEEEVNPKDNININKLTEYKTEDDKGIIGFATPGNYKFIGIGKSNNKCLIETNESKILVYSKGQYDVNIISSDIRKIQIKSKNGLLLKICYFEYPINDITNIISEYFKNDKIIEILNLTDNLDENWNDILSITLNNSINNNDFSNPNIQIITKNVNRNISEISTRYNFQIIMNNFRKNNKDIIDDANLISAISQNYEEFNFNNDELLVWIMNYVEKFTTSNGIFFKYFEKQNFSDKERESFINFIIAHKIASLYLKINSEKEIELISMLNNIVNSNQNLNLLIKKAIIEYGLVKENNNYQNYYYYNIQDEDNYQSYYSTYQ